MGTKGYDVKGPEVRKVAHQGGNDQRGVDLNGHCHILLPIAALDCCICEET